jgi:UDP-N-acetylglucosamine acyltransferase
MKETYIHPTAIIYPNVTIGEGCYIGPYCIIGGPPEHADIDPLNPPTHGVWIGDNVRLYGHVTVDAGAFEQTHIEDGCMIMNGAYIAHDCHIFRNVIVSSGARIAGCCAIGECSYIGINTSIHQYTGLAKGTMLGASAFVKGYKTEQWRILAGVPARDIGENKVGRARWEK